MCQDKAIPRVGGDWFRPVWVAGSRMSKPYSRRVRSSACDVGKVLWAFGSSPIKPIVQKSMKNEDTKRNWYCCFLCFKAPFDPIIWNYYFAIDIPLNISGLKPSCWYQRLLPRVPPGKGIKDIYPASLRSVRIFLHNINTGFALSWTKPSSYPFLLCRANHSLSIIGGKTLFVETHWIRKDTPCG